MTDLERKRYSIPLPPSVNHLYFNTKFGRVRTVTYKKWIDEAAWEIKRQRTQKWAGIVWIEYYANRPDKRKRDITNLVKAADDLLVHTGLIEDDSKIAGCAIRWYGQGDKLYFSIRSATKSEIEEGCFDPA